MVDGTIIRAHQHAAGAVGGQEKQALGRCRGGFSSKIHAFVDSFGLPINFVISPGQDADVTYGEDLITEQCEFLLGDRGYDSDRFRNSLRARNMVPVIPGRKNRREPVEYDKDIYKERNRVERFFCRIKNFRRIATRYDKTAIVFHGAVTFVAIILLLKV